MSSKQEGISNADTGRSELGKKLLEVSKKGEGAPESAKHKGTVSTDRPQVSAFA